eukprot:scaffold2549_cov108-Isochrysis_galbana.AAC.8
MWRYATTPPCGAQRAQLQLPALAPQLSLSRSWLAAFENILQIAYIELFASRVRVCGVACGGRAVRCAMLPLYL